MKKYLLIIVGLLIHFSVSAQTITVTTWYVTPPTAGCNGIWAVDATAWPCSTAGCTYLFPTPFGCTPSIPTCDSIVADTLYIPLCSLPCNLAASCSPGPVVICGTPPPVTTGIDQPTRSEIKTSFNSEKILTVQNLKADELIELYDVTGRQIKTQKCYGTSSQIDFNSLSKQVYILIVRNKANEIVFRKKVA